MNTVHWFDGLRITPMNNPITLISPVQSLARLNFSVAPNSICVALQIYKQFSPKARNANPLDVKPEPDFNAK